MAAYLLLIPPAGDSCVVGTLRRAADQAFARGSPDSAVSYLERCLHEPPPEAERADVLLQLGTAAQLLDAAKSADYLTAAMATTEDPQHKAAIAEILAVTLFNAGRGTAASQVVSQGIQVLNMERSDLHPHQRLPQPHLIVDFPSVDTGCEVPRAGNKPRYPFGGRRGDPFIVRLGRPAGLGSRRAAAAMCRTAR